MNQRPFAEYLRYGIPLGNGIMMLKPFERPGLLVGYRFRGHDTLGSSWDELKHRNRQYARAFSGLDNQWTSHICLDHRPGAHYPQEGFWPHRLLFVLDQLRRISYETEGVHYRTDQTLWLTYYPGMVRTSLIDSLFGSSERAIHDALGYFEGRIQEFEDIIRPHLIEFTRLGTYQNAVSQFESLTLDSSLENIHRLIYGTDRRIGSTADIPLALDDLLAQPVKHHPRLQFGDTYVNTLSVWGMPGMLFPAYCDSLRHMRSSFKIVNRIVPYSRAQGLTKLQNVSRNHLITSISPTIILARKGEEGKESSLHLRGQVQREKNAAELGARHALSQMTVVAYGPDPEAVDDTAHTLREVLSSRGFTVREEDDSNRFSAALGSLPGETERNLVRGAPLPMEAAMAIAPFSSSWHGQARHPDKRFGPNARPLLMLSTAMSEEFQFFTHVGQLGNALFVGPPGVGKSVMLNAVRVGHLCGYEGARVVSYDVGRSNYKLARFIGAHHAHPRMGGGPMIYLLRNIEDPEWFEAVLDIYKLVAFLWMKRPTTINEDGLLEAGLKALATMPHGQRRASDMVNFLPMDDLRQALNKLAGSMFDAWDDDLRFDDPSLRMFAFELGDLGVDNTDWTTPLVRYLELRSFLEIARLDDVPTLFDADEFARLMKLPNVAAYAERIEREGRKHRWNFVYATQGCSEILASSIRSVLVVQTPTKIAGANRDARIPDIAQQYQDCGFHPDDPAIIADLGEHDMLVRNQYGVQIVTLNPTAAELAIFGGASNDDCDFVDQCIQQYGLANAPSAYLRSFGKKDLNDVADTLDQLARQLSMESAA
jgi:hypothetical protein